MKKISIVLFDLDGVLVDLCDGHYNALNKALRELINYEIPREDHEKLYNGLPTKVKIKALNDCARLPVSLNDEVFELKQQYTLEEIKKFSTDWDKVRLMEALKSHNIKIGIVSNSIRETIDLSLKQIGIVEYIDLIVSNEDFPGKMKPNPAPYNWAIMALNSCRDNTIIIEDSPHGIKSAIESGANVINVKNAKEVTVGLIFRKIAEIENQGLYANLEAMKV